MVDCALSSGRRRLSWVANKAIERSNARFGFPWGFVIIVRTIDQLVRSNGARRMVRQRPDKLTMCAR